MNDQPERLSGQIKVDTAGHMGFQYDGAWVNAGFAISQQLGAFGAIL